MSAWNKGLYVAYCFDCDGCGWYEGGKTIKTECDTCWGSGLMWHKKGGIPVRPFVRRKLK